jgi:hypothetical protein
MDKIKQEIEIMGVGDIWENEGIRTFGLNWVEDL